MTNKSIRDYINLIENAQREGVAEAEKKPHPQTWHDVDPKLGKAVDKMSQAEKVKKGLAHPDTLKKKGVAEAAGLYGPFTVTINTGERPQSRTKTKKFRREDDAILWAQDWLEDFSQYPFATAEVTDPDGNVVWTTDEEDSPWAPAKQGVAEGSEEGNLYAMALQRYPRLKRVDREIVINALNGAYEDYLMHYGYEGIGPDEESSMIDHAVKGLKQGVAEAAKWRTHPDAHYHDYEHDDERYGQKRAMGDFDDTEDELRGRTFKDVEGGKLTKRGSDYRKAYIKRSLGKHPEPNLPEGVAEGSLNEGQYEMMMRNGQVKKFVAKDDADAKRIAAGHGAKSVIRLKGGVPAGKVSEQGVAEGVATTWEVSYDYGPHMTKTVTVKASSEEEAVAKVEKAAEKKGLSIMINSVTPAEQGVAEEQLEETSPEAIAKIEQLTRN